MERAISTPTSVSPAFKERQESAQRITQIEEHFAAEQLCGIFGRLTLCCRGICRCRSMAVFAQVAPSARDSKTFVIQEALDFKHEINIFLAVHAMAAETLDRFQHGELSFPVAKDERLQLGQAANLADTVEALVGGGLCAGAVGHGCCSGHLSRSGRAGRICINPENV